VSSTEWLRNVLIRIDRERDFEVLLPLERRERSAREVAARRHDVPRSSAAH